MEIWFLEHIASPLMLIHSWGNKGSSESSDKMKWSEAVTQRTQELESLHDDVLAGNGSANVHL